MCFHTKVTKSIEEIEELYSITRSEGLKAPGVLEYYHANGFAHPLMWAIPQEKSKRITPMMWGLIPPEKSGADHEEYYKETIRYGSGLNARSEKLFSSGHYKGSALTRRCIIPVDGFFEPHTAPKKFKIPFYFSMKDKSMVNLAGIYTITDDKYVTFAILTKAATPLFAKIHNSKERRTVILTNDQIGDWLTDNLSESEVMDIISNDVPDSEISAYPVSKDLFSPKIDSDRPDITEKVEYPQLEITY